MDSPCYKITDTHKKRKHNPPSSPYSSQKKKNFLNQSARMLSRCLKSIAWIRVLLVNLELALDISRIFRDDSCDNANVVDFSSVPSFLGIVFLHLLGKGSVPLCVYTR